MCYINTVSKEMVYRLQGQSSINRRINGIFLFNSTFRKALGQTNVLSSGWWTSQVRSWTLTSM